MKDDDSGVDDRDDIGAADEQALRTMFAALVQDAAPSELSPLQVQRLARAEHGATLDRRIKRLKFTRNALVAAVLAGVVALVAPHLGSPGTETAASSSSASSTSAAAAAAPAEASSAAAGTFAASSGAGGLAPMSAGSGDGSSAASAPAGGGAATSAAGGASAAPAPAGTSAAPSGAMSSSAMSSGAASSGGASGGGSSSASPTGASAAAGCVPVSPRWFAPVRAALPGYRGTIRITSCTAETSGGPSAGTVAFVVSNATSGVCVKAADGGCQPVAGTPVPGTKDAYADRGAVTVVGTGGLSVRVTSTAGGPDRPELIAAARTLLKTLG